MDIDIEDENDTPPTFTSTLYESEVTEGGQSDSSVSRVFVSDLDPDSSLTLSLEGDDSSNFRIGQDGEWCWGDLEIDLGVYQLTLTLTYSSWY